MGTPQFGDREASSEQASRVMEGNTSQDTEPEVMLRKTLWHRGHRYRKNVRELPGNPDIVFPGSKVAVFCDGDFWHGRDWESLREKLENGENADYWVPKIKANRDRDRRQTRELRNEGWTVLRLWGTDIKDDVERAANRVEQALSDAQS